MNLKETIINYLRVNRNFIRVRVLAEAAKCPPQTLTNAIMDPSINLPDKYVIPLMSAILSKFDSTRLEVIRKAYIDLDGRITACIVFSYPLASDYDFTIYFLSIAETLPDSFGQALDAGLAKYKRYFVNETVNYNERILRVKVCNTFSATEVELIVSNIYDSFVSSIKSK